MTEKIPVGFSASDFFYKNVNAPVQFNKSENATICDLSENKLRNKIKTYFDDLSFNKTGVQPKINSKAGQCVIEIAESVNLNAATSWKMVYKKDSNGKQVCSCEKETTDFIPSEPNVFQKTIPYATSTTKYTCKASSISQLRDEGITELPKTLPDKQLLVDKSVEYYKLVCENKRLATELQNGLTINLDGDLKYEDISNSYNREYLNRINLGVGIVFTIGFILYCINAKPISKLPIASIPLPNIPIPKQMNPLPNNKM